MFARYVVPLFQELNTHRLASMEWVKANNPQFTSERDAAVDAPIAQHIRERGADSIASVLAEAVGFYGKIAS